MSKFSCLFLVLILQLAGEVHGLRHTSSFLTPRDHERNPSELSTADAEKDKTVTDTTEGEKGENQKTGAGKMKNIKEPQKFSFVLHEDVDLDIIDSSDGEEASNSVSSKLRRSFLPSQAEAVANSNEEDAMDSSDVQTVDTTSRLQLKSDVFLHRNSVSDFKVGAVVTVDGIKKKPELNGKQGIVTEFIKDTGRYGVKLIEGYPRGEYSFLPDNLISFRTAPVKIQAEAVVNSNESHTEGSSDKQKAEAVAVSDGEGESVLTKDVKLDEFLTQMGIFNFGSSMTEDLDVKSDEEAANSGSSGGSDEGATKLISSLLTSQAEAVAKSKNEEDDSSKKGNWKLGTRRNSRQKMRPKSDVFLHLNSESATHLRGSSFFVQTEGVAHSNESQRVEDDVATPDVQTVDTTEGSGENQNSEKGNWNVVSRVVTQQKSFVSELSKLLGLDEEDVKGVMRTINEFVDIEKQKERIERMVQMGRRLPIKKHSIARAGLVACAAYLFSPSQPFDHSPRVMEVNGLPLLHGTFYAVGRVDDVGFSKFMSEELNKMIPLDQYRIKKVAEKLKITVLDKYNNEVNELFLSSKDIKCLKFTFDCLKTKDGKSCNSPIQVVNASGILDDKPFTLDGKIRPKIYGLHKRKNYPNVSLIKKKLDNTMTSPEARARIGEYVYKNNSKYNWDRVLQYQELESDRKHIQRIERHNIKKWSFEVIPFRVSGNKLNTKPFRYDVRLYPDETVHKDVNYAIMKVHGAGVFWLAPEAASYPIKSPQYQDLQFLTRLGLVDYKPLKSGNKRCS